MDKAYTRITWQNSPSVATPLGATNLNKLDLATDSIDNRVVAMDTSKANVTTINAMVRDITFTNADGKFTITYQNGTTTVIDTAIEKIVTNFSYNATTQTIDLILADGSTQSIDISSFVTNVDFENTSTVAWSVVEGKTRATVPDGSITDAKIESGYLASVTIQAGIATAQAALSKRYAVGGVVEGDATDNAKYYYEQAQAIVGIDIATTEVAGIVKPDGTTISVDVDGVISVAGGGTVTAETVGSGVLYNSGGLVTAQSTPNMTVAISACTAYMPTGERAVISAVASQTITTADATNPRKDIMYVNSSKVTSYLVGTASATPTAPSLPSGGVLLAEIYVGANVTSITNANIIDRRSIIKSNADLVEEVNVLIETKAESGFATSMPTGYKILEYIESTGTQRIDLDVVDSADFGFEIDAQYLGLSTEVLDGGFIALSNGTNINYYHVFGILENTNKFNVYCTSDGTWKTIHNYTTERYNYRLMQDTIYWNGSQIAASVNHEASTSYNISLFCRRNTNTYSYSKYRLYKCKIYNKADIVRDLIPVQRDSDSAIGLLDLITNTFYANAGTGVFLTGNTIIENIHPYSLNDVYNKNSERHFLLIGDSYGANTRTTTQWGEIFASTIPNVRQRCVSSIGFTTHWESTSPTSFSDVLQTFIDELTDSERKEITDIVVCGGWNDASMGTYNSSLAGAIKVFYDKAVESFINATIHVGFVSNQTNDIVQTGVTYDRLVQTLSVYRNTRYKNLHYLANVEYALKQNAFMDSSFFHPNDNGMTILANAIMDALFGGYSGCNKVSFITNNNVTFETGVSNATDDIMFCQVNQNMSSIRTNTGSLILTNVTPTATFKKLITYSANILPYAHVTLERISAMFVGTIGGTNTSLSLYMYIGSDRTMNMFVPTIYQNVAWSGTIIFPTIVLQNDGIDNS